MNLDLTDQDYSEDQLLFNIKKAFDEQRDISIVRVTSGTALNLHNSPALHVAIDTDTYGNSEPTSMYVTPLGEVKVVPVPATKLATPQMELE